MAKRAFWVAGAAVAALVVFVGYRSLSSPAPSETQRTETVVVRAGTVTPTLSVTGQVSSANERRIRSSGGGRVEEIYVNVGDVVTAGQRLIRLDDGQAHRTLNIASANLTSARARLQELRDKGASSAEIAAQQAAITKANADYQDAAEQHDDAVITAPINGTVLSISAAVGEEAGSGSGGGGASGSASTGSQSTGSSGELMAVADISQLRINVAIDQADVAKVAPGQRVKISLDAFPGKRYEGQLTSIDPVPQTNQNVVTYTAYVAFDKVDPVIRLGMSADLEINLGKKENVLVVPNTAIRTRGDEQTVSKVVDGEQVDVAVETGASDDERTEITSGLSSGDRISLQSFTQPTQRTFTGGPFGGGPFGGGGARRGGFAPR